MLDRFQKAVGGVALVAILTTGFLLAAGWDQQDMGLRPLEQVR